MSGAERYPQNEPPYGQPLPLHLPIDDVLHHDPRSQRNRDPHPGRGPNSDGDRDRGDDRDLPGSHVIIIDLA